MLVVQNNFFGFCRRPGQVARKLFRVFIIVKITERRHAFFALLAFKSVEVYTSGVYTRRRARFEPQNFKTHLTQTVGQPVRVRKTVGTAVLN